MPPKIRVSLAADNSTGPIAGAKSTSIIGKGKNLETSEVT